MIDLRTIQDQFPIGSPVRLDPDSQQGHNRDCACITGLVKSYQRHTVTKDISIRVRFDCGHTEIIETEKLR